MTVYQVVLREPDAVGHIELLVHVTADFLEAKKVLEEVRGSLRGSDPNKISAICRRVIYEDLAL